MRIRLSPLTWFAVGAAGILSLVSANPALTAASMAVLFLISGLLWREGEPPALAFAMGYTWLQGCIVVLYSDWMDLPLDDYDTRGLSVGGYFFDGTLNEATWLTLGGVAAVTLGLAWGAGRRRSKAAQKAVATGSRRLSTRKLFIGCLVALGGNSLIAVLTSLLPSLRIPLLALGNLHWVMVYLLAVAVMQQGTGRAELLAILAIELAAGFLSFFSEFKIVLIVVFIAVLSVPGALKGSRAFAAAGLVAIALLLGLVWTTIKLDYRNFMNQDSREQAIVVSTSDQADELMRLLGEVSPEKLERGILGFVHRLSYVYFFAEALDYVPRYQPHEDGALWLNAFTRAFLPRFVNPDKEEFDDSARTAKYTGLVILGGDGTSVSLGYVAETYIDFGRLGMMGALCAWGVFLGFLARTLMNRTSDTPAGDACAAVMIALNASLLEQSNANMVGGVLATFVVFWVLERYYLQRALRLFAKPAPGALSRTPAVSQA